MCVWGWGGVWILPWPCSGAGEEIFVGETPEAISDGLFLFLSPFQKSCATTPTAQCHRDCGCRGTPSFR